MNPPRPARVTPRPAPTRVGIGTWSQHVAHLWQSFPTQGAGHHHDRRRTAEPANSSHPGRPASRSAMPGRRTQSGAARCFVLTGAMTLASAGPGFTQSPAPSIVLDGSLGGPRHALEPNASGFVPIPAELGVQSASGANLFHSFSLFSLGPGQRAVFTGPDTIQNLIARVTGGEASRIDGTLGSTLPKAHLYFINPAGILFGPEARLDLPGSFSASTADYLVFADGRRLAMTGPAEPVLISAPPTHFGFLDSSSPRGSIEVRGSLLETRAGARLDLIAGGPSVSDAEPSIRIDEEARLLTPSGTLTLEARGPGEHPINRPLPGSSEAALDLDGGTILVRSSILTAPDMPPSGARDAGTPSPTTATTGRILIRGGRLVLESADIQARTAPISRSGTSIEIAARSVELRAGSHIRSDNYMQGKPPSDSLPSQATIQAEQIRLTEGSSILTGTFGAAPGGEVTLTANTITLSGDLTTIASDTAFDGSGGRIAIEARDHLILQDGAAISASTTIGGSTGSGGKVEIRAGHLAVDGGAIRSETHGSGASGEIEIVAGTIRLDNGATITSIAGANPFGPSGDARRILVEATVSLHSRDSAVTVDAKDSNAGDIIVRSPSVIMDDTQFRATALQGDGGTILINTRGFVRSASSVTSVDSRSGTKGSQSIPPFELFPPTEPPDLQTSYAPRFTPPRREPFRPEDSEGYTPASDRRSRVGDGRFRWQSE